MTFITDKHLDIIERLVQDEIEACEFITNPEDNDADPDDYLQAEEDLVELRELQGVLVRERQQRTID